MKKQPLLLARTFILGACGDFADVTRMIANPRYIGNPSAHETNIYKRFAYFKK